MKGIEPSSQQATPGLTRKIADFWTRNVNAERLFGRSVSAHPRGSDGYFADLEAQRYRTHRHLPPWIASMTPGRSVLEVGSGIGLDSWRMASSGLEVTAIDLTTVGAATAAARFARNGRPARFAAADAGSLPFPDASFDYVYSFGVLHHAADTARCIDEVRRVLRPGGEALIMLYHRRSLNELVHRIMRVPFEEKDELCPVVRRYTRDEVRELFRDYASVDVHADYLFGEGYGALYRWFPDFLYRPLSRWIGWHLMIRAVR
ncbi:MAG TPA: class I SAM-dependent methyltransferase [Xanthomonadales bacterium]|nr:class I SAM-dependent methyltransferase [Xanthomonadales bacterium]